MRRSRLSIRSVLFLIAIFGVGFAALKHPTNWWSGGLLLGDLCLFVFAAMAIAYRQGSRRAFWLGFALFGWAYLVIGFAPGLRVATRPYLLSTRALERAWPKERDKTLRLTVLLRYDAALAIAQRSAPTSSVKLSDDMSSREVALAASSKSPASYVVRKVARRGPGSEEFYRVGHPLSALLAAMIGGGIAWTLFAARADRPERAAK
jgi:hypothetical protein